MTEKARRSLWVAGVVAALVAGLIAAACGGGEAETEARAADASLEQTPPASDAQAEARLKEAGASAGGGPFAQRLDVLAQGPELKGLDAAALVDPPVLSLTVGDAQGPDGGPAVPGVTFPSGTTRLVYEMIYDGMQDGLSWEDRWFRDGLPVESLRGPRPPWAAGTRGRLVSGAKNANGFADGVYDLQILVRGSVLARRTVTIGQVPVPEPVLSNPRWQADAPPLEGGEQTRFASGVRELVLRIDRRGAGAVQEWMVIWFLEGEEVLRFGPEPQLVNRDEITLALTHPLALPAGDYSVEVYYDGEIAASFTGVTVERGAPG